MSPLLNAAVKVSIILAAGFVASALLRRRSAALRHWVLAAAVICAAATPLLELIVPAWRVPATAWSLPSRAIDPSEWITPRDATIAASAAAIPRREAATVFTWLTVPRALGAVWLAGALISFLTLLVGLARLSWLASRAQPVRAGRWADAAASVSRGFGLKRPVALLQSEHPTLLVTWGVFRPTVILPAPARDWSEARVRVVVCHELAHIRRGDWIVQLVAELLRSAYWFNPLLWIACGRVRQESEHACDDAVLRLGVEGPDYAAHLLDVARSFKAHRQLWSPALAIARPSSLERRVRAMLNAHLDRNPITRSACLLAAAALLAVTVPIAGFTVFADAGATILSGSVLDQFGRGVPDATVALSNAQTRERHEVHSDQTGHFAFIALPSGEYAMDARRMGFTTLQGKVALAGANMQRDLTLEIGMIHESVTVSPGSSQPAFAKAPGSRRPQSEVDPCSSSPLGGCLLPPMKVVDVRPIYPDGVTAKAEGSVVKVDAHITTDGSVARLQVLSADDPAFANAALDAVGQWQFTPTHLDGTAIDTRMLVVVMFKP
ncbi:MAG TPA: M56 family metallopeptidase [Vicinamibacterales bacterium]|nr:M56 family metallopeptidase [Vicinamibacterales bacterium]